MRGPMATYIDIVKKVALIAWSIKKVHSPRVFQGKPDTQDFDPMLSRVTRNNHKLTIKFRKYNKKTKYKFTRVYICYANIRVILI